MSSIDITKNIRAIEGLKCDLLNDLSTLFRYMQKPAQLEDGEETLASMLLHLYLLANKLGLDFTQLDAAAVSRLKRSALDERRTPEERALLAHLTKTLV